MEKPCFSDQNPNQNFIITTYSVITCAGILELNEFGKQRDFCLSYSQSLNTAH